MLQVTAHAAVQSGASGDPCIISKSGIRAFIRTGRRCKCGAAGTTSQSVVSGQHCITASSFIRTKKASQEKDVSQEMDFTLFAEAPTEQFSNQQPKAIYPSSPICAKNMSLDKSYDHVLTSAGIMTKRTSGLVHCPGKNKSCHQKNFSQTSATTETSAAACQKIEVEQKCIDQRK